MLQKYQMIFLSYSLACNTFEITLGGTQLVVLVDNDTIYIHESVICVTITCKGTIA